MQRVEGTTAQAPRLLRRVVDVRAGEAAPLLWSFAYFFALLCGYYLLRPIREEMGIRGGIGRLHWVFTATFVVMLAAVPLYAPANSSFTLALVHDATMSSAQVQGSISLSGIILN